MQGVELDLCRQQYQADITLPRWDDAWAPEPEERPLKSLFTAPMARAASPSVSVHNAYTQQGCDGRRPEGPPNRKGKTRMRKRNRTRGRVLLAAAALTALFAGTAFTAGNTVPDSKAGTGTATVSGYTATSIDYTLNADPTKIDSVAMDISSLVTSGSTAKVQLATSGAWYDCVISTEDGPDATADTEDDYSSLACTTTGALVADASNMTLVIAD